MNGILIVETHDISVEQILELYEANHWSSAEKPTALYKALMNSHSLVSAWDGAKLVGLANAISDGHLMVYFPHLLVLPAYQGKGIGKLIMERMEEKYRNFHMQMLTADGESVGFYEKMGFEKAGMTVPMWKYKGKEH
ncbi:GNAT family N-acetyltransferase [Echinicola sp. CAU 1574]|uniref:GNAT family N-acetyltransferase n=1 Tax=Echinicola arenosa TaxID=2774144 RepID=A0ABR9AJ68_9BACT|nr:GNAT family N-acetyltransferase [Echinicola arenosa]MBD8488846.1 GNAT family N-acetyltransferase [Echinicola arenosa]